MQFGCLKFLNSLLLAHCHEIMSKVQQNQIYFQLNMQQPKTIGGSHQLNHNIVWLLFIVYRQCHSIKLTGTGLRQLLQYFEEHY